MDVRLNSRRDAVRLFLDMIRPLKPFYSTHHAFLHIGNTGVHYGEKSARMEGYARVLWGLGPLWSVDNSTLPSEEQKEILEWLELYKDGMIHGTNPADDEYWGSLHDYDQKMVEIAALAFAITLNRGKLWDSLSDEERDNLYRWLNQMNAYEMPPNNWRYFRIMTNMMFRLLGLPWSEKRMKEDFDIIETSYIGDGWYYDGNPDQIDYYVAFAIHYYGLVYAKLMESEDPQRCRILRERSTAFFDDFVYWFANNGEEIPFGRSLTYRFAHCGPFAAMAYAGLDIPYGILKNLVLRNLESWVKRPIFDNAGILTIGYGYPNILMSESYNGCGSPYWSTKAFLILGFPEDHPFWQAELETYPYEPEKFLKHPHMIVTHDEHHHAMAYVTGQHLHGDHGQGAAKYEKFVYSNQFGFSVFRGANLSEGGFDNTIAVSVKGEDRYCMRYGIECFHAEEGSLFTRYSPMTGVVMESTVIPCMAWHVRIHKIMNEIAIDIADGGFALPQERCFEVEKGEGTGLFSKEDVQAAEHSVIADFPWGISGVISETGQEARLVTSFPNTNLFYNHTVIPTVVSALEPGIHLVVTSVVGDFHRGLSELLRDKPVVEITEHQVKVIYRGQETVFIR